MLEVKQVSKAFKQNTVLSNIDLTIKEGELIYLHGINGSGKSTLFKIICDIIKSDTGTISKGDTVKIGALIENPGFLENQNLQFNLKFLGNLTKAFNEDKAKALCKRFMLDYNSKTNLKAYSVGMRQKVGIIQAIMEDQNLILFDEPTRGLDSDSVEIFYDLVQTLVQEGKSVLIAAHDRMEEVKFTRILELKNASIIES